MTHKDTLVGSFVRQTAAIEKHFSAENLASVKTVGAGSFSLKKTTQELTHHLCAHRGLLTTVLESFSPRPAYILAGEGGAPTVYINISLSPLDGSFTFLFSALNHWL
jgi:glycerol kinase